MSAPVPPVRVGPYVLEAPLARGPAAELHIAVDARGRRVVLKLHDRVAGEPTGLAELQLLGLEHPGLAAALDALRIPGDGRLVTVSEYVDGRPLGPGALPPGPQAARRLAQRLLAALAVLHERGLLHRDLKEDNVVVEGATGRPVLLDFGLCCRMGEAAGRLAAGTPRTLAPELFAGGVASAASDLWSAGLLLAEASAGRRLLRATGLEEAAAERRAWRGLPPELEDQDPPLAAVLRRLLALRPEERPADARAALAALPALDGDERQQLLREDLVARVSGALAEADPRREARTAALRRGACWIELGATAEGGIDEDRATVLAWARSVREPGPELEARLAAAGAGLLGARAADVAGLLGVLAGHGPLVVALPAARRAALAPLREALAALPRVEVWEEPLLGASELAASLRAVAGERVELERRVREHGPLARDRWAAALDELLRAGVLRAGELGLVVDESALRPGWPAADDGRAAAARLVPGERVALALLALSPRALDEERWSRALGADVSSAARALEERGLVRRLRSVPRALFVAAARGGWAAAAAPPEARRRLAVELLTEADEDAAAGLVEVLGAEAPPTPDEPGLAAGIVRAAARLRDAGRIPRAIALLRRALAGGVPGTAGRRQIHLDLADLALRQGEVEDSLAACAVARIELPDDDALGVREARAQLRRGRSQEALDALAPLDPDRLPGADAVLLLQVRAQAAHALGRLDAALADAREALRRHGSTADRRAMALLEFAGNVAKRLGRSEDAVRLLEASIAMGKELGQELLLGSVYYNLGDAIRGRGEKRRGLQMQEQAVGLLERAGDLVGLATTLNGLGAGWLSLGNLDVARRHLARALQLARRAGDEALQGQVLNNTARVLAAECRLDEAEALFAESLDLRSRRGDRRGMAAVALTRGAVRLARGRQDEAERDLGAARTALAGLVANDWEVEADLLEARLRLAEARPDGALACARRAHERATRCALGREALVAVDLLARAGEHGLALALQPELLERGPWLADLLFTRGQIHGQQGRGTEAEADFALALSILGETPDGPVEARGLLLRAELDLDALAGALASAAPDLLLVGKLLARVEQDGERANALVEAHDLGPLRAQRAALHERLAGLRRGGGLSGLGLMAERLRTLESLAGISRLLNIERDAQRLLDLIVDSAIELTGAARGFLILFDGRSEEIRAARNIDESSIRQPEFEISHSLARRVVKEGRPLLTANAIGDPRLLATASISELRLLSILCVPLVSRARTLGAIYLDHPRVVGRFTERHLQTATELAEQAAIALENARLQEGLSSTNHQLRRSREEIERLNAALQQRLERQAAELEQVKESLDASRQALRTKYDYSGIVTDSPAMHVVLDLLDRITDTDFPVIIEGESGTGKELIARAIHFNGPRKEKNLLSLNCAAIAEPLIESELFGSVRGAFTGADRDRKGLFEQAHQGTLFLDEIGDMSLGVQKRLLRVLQEGEFLPVGGRELREVDVRVLCATHRDLRAMAASGTFREDLYYRLAVGLVRLPPLRERQEDLAPLLQHFLTRHGGAPRVVEIEALALLQRQPWPGNVRQLENAVMNLLLFDPQGTAVTESQVRRLLSSMGGALAEPGPASESEDAEGASLRARLEAYERAQVLEALRRAGGNKARAARELGLGIRTLYKILERLGLSV